MKECEPAVGENADGSGGDISTSKELVQSRENWINAWGKCAAQNLGIRKWFDDPTPD